MNMDEPKKEKTDINISICSRSCLVKTEIISYKYRFTRKV